MKIRLALPQIPGISVSQAGGLAAAAATLLMTACSGGGGGSSGSLHISLSPNPVTASVYAAQTNTSVDVTASVTGTVSASVVYAVVSDSANTFQHGQLSFTQTGNTTYTATLQTDSGLSTGRHHGTLSLNLCGDPACNSNFGSASVPYTITVQPNPVVKATASPSTLSLTAFQGLIPSAWEVAYTFSMPSDFPFSLYAQFSDASGFLQLWSGQGAYPNSILPMDSSPKTVFFSASPNAAIGTYTGTVKMTMCADSACQVPLDGGNNLPYTITIGSGSNLSPLSPLSGAGDWLMLQGNTAHNGYVPVSLDPAKFSPRWQWTPPQGSDGALTEVVTSNDNAYMMVMPPGAPSMQIYALKEADGSIAWQRAAPIPNGMTFPVLGQNQLAIGNGQLNVPVGPELWADPAMTAIETFDLGTGNPGSSQPVNGYISQFGNPMVWNSNFGTNQQNSYITPTANVLAVPVAVPTGITTLSWSFALLGSGAGGVAGNWASCAQDPNTNFGGAVSYDSSGKAYVATEAGLLMPNSCALIAAAGSPNVSLGPVVAKSSPDVVVAGNGNLYDFDVSSNTLKWSLTAPSPGDGNTFVGSPVIAGGTVYVLNEKPHQIEARSLTDGHLLWSWAPDAANDPGPFSGNLIVTKTTVFASSAQLYAVDLGTHKAVWSYPQTGALALSSNGILYIKLAGTSNSLTAINLH